jgi:hypothetical protein
MISGIKLPSHFLHVRAIPHILRWTKMLIWPLSQARHASHGRVMHHGIGRPFGGCFDDRLRIGRGERACATTRH